MNYTALILLAGLILLLIWLPILGYVTIKLGVIGFYRGRQWFESNTKERNENGKDKR